MGSLPEDTICGFCDREYAGYIPDPFTLPMGGQCLDLLVTWDIEPLITMRLRRRVRNWRTISRLTAFNTLHNTSPLILHLLQNDLIAEQIALYCINM